jgi:hypothetical protein
MLCVGAWTLSAQNEVAMHPRIAAAITALTDARAYLAQAPQDFGGHKNSAIKACDNALRELHKALEYREHKDR